MVTVSLPTICLTELFVKQLNVVVIPIANEACYDIHSRQAVAMGIVLVR